MAEKERLQKESVGVPIANMEIQNLSIQVNTFGGLLYTDIKWFLKSLYKFMAEIFR